MFHLPDAKRVRRDDLSLPRARSDSPGAGSDAGPRLEKTAGDADDLDRARMAAALDAELGALLEFETVESSASAREADAGPGPGEGEEKQDESGADDAGFAFRLFATQDPSGVKVVLSPAKAVGAGVGADGEEGGIVNARPRTFYLAKPSAEDTARYEAVAVSGEDLMKRSTARCWGLEVPWRVTKISASKKHMKVLLEKGGTVGLVTQNTLDNGSSEDEEGEKPKRKRPGKKRRIVLRTREKVKKVKEAEAHEKKVAKEEHLREKKARLNRERKLKRRQKARDEKAAAKATGAAGGDEASGSD